MRLFVGVFPPAAALADLRRTLPAGLNLTPVAQWHLTLVFLGEVAGERVGDVERALDRVGTEPRSIELRLAGSGRFENARSAALWVGVAGDLVGLSSLQAAIRGSLADAGFGSNERAFRPHLTIAYSRDRPALAPYAGPAWQVDEFVLVRSRHNEGGGYHRLRSWAC